MEQKNLQSVRKLIQGILRFLSFKDELKIIVVRLVRIFVFRPVLRYSHS